MSMALRKKNDTKLMECEAQIIRKESFGLISLVSPCFQLSVGFTSGERHQKRTTETFCCQEINIEEIRS